MKVLKIGGVLYVYLFLMAMIAYVGYVLQAPLAVYQPMAIIAGAILGVMCLFNIVKVVES